MFIVWFNITSETGANFWVCIEFSDFQRGWGMSYGRKTGVSCHFNHTEGFGGFYFSTVYNYNLYPDYILFDLYFNRTSNKMNAVFYLYQQDQPKPYLMNFGIAGSEYEEEEDAYSINADDFVNVTITMTYWHGGSGYFQGDASLEIHTNDSYYPGVYEHAVGIENDIWSFIGALEQALGSVLPDPLKDFVNMVGGWFNSLIAILPVLFSSITQFAPFLPFIVFAYFLDAISTSVQTGNLQPVGNVVMTLYHLAVSVINAIVGIIQTIYDFIHFW